VTSFRSFARYHEQHAALWERQALLRARPVAGAERLGQAFEESRLEILLRPLPDDATDETHRVRQRMESEIAREDHTRRDFKTGRGGLTDIEMAVQLLQLRHGSEHAALLATDRTDVQLERLESLGLLEHADASAFREGWAFLTRLSSRLRILDNRSISDLDEERGDLDGLARRLGYESQQREGARRLLLADYRRITDEVRAAYLRVLGVPAKS
jgi:glutamate-ammonia-ligase adenylyltransferase